jgi:uncharacterized phage infection (PIP) family protein YhgE
MRQEISEIMQNQFAQDFSDFGSLGDIGSNIFSKVYGSIAQAQSTYMQNQDKMSEIDQRTFSKMLEHQETVGKGILDTAQKFHQLEEKVVGLDDTIGEDLDKLNKKYKDVYKDDAGKQRTSSKLGLDKEARESIISKKNLLDGVSERLSTTGRKSVTEALGFDPKSKTYIQDVSKALQDFYKQMAAEKSLNRNRQDTQEFLAALKRLAEGTHQTADEVKEDLENLYASLDNNAVEYDILNDILEVIKQRRKK